MRHGQSCPSRISLASRHGGPCSLAAAYRPAPWLPVHVHGFPVWECHGFLHPRIPGGKIRSADVFCLEVKRLCGTTRTKINTRTHAPLQLLHRCCTGLGDRRLGSLLHAELGPPVGLGPSLGDLAIVPPGIGRLPGGGALIDLLISVFILLGSNIAFENVIEICSA